jgi:hypothetical protein
MPRKTKQPIPTKTQKIIPSQSKFAFSILDGIVLVIFIAVAVLVGMRIHEKNTGEVAGQETTTSAQSAESIKLQGVDGVSAYDLLAKDHKVGADKTDFGVFVNSIDGVSNSDSKYWIYYVNGQIGEVAADKYVTKEGDEIEWRYQTLE